jgi:hypothetical protein
LISRLFDDDGCDDDFGLLFGASACRCAEAGECLATAGRIRDGDFDRVRRRLRTSRCMFDLSTGADSPCAPLAPAVRKRSVFDWLEATPSTGGRS